MSSSSTQKKNASDNEEKTNTLSELRMLVELSRKYMWDTGDARRFLEAFGVNLSRGDFYSETPTLNEIETSFEFVHRSAQEAECGVFDDERVFLDRQLLSVADSLIEFALQMEAPIGQSDGFFWQNSQFSSIDALVYYSIIRKQKPAQVFEIGSGYSTHVAAMAIKENGSGALTCVDPEPRSDISGIPGLNIKKTTVQSLDVDALLSSLKPGDIVFYDGSHALKTGSDTVFFYLKILPYLPSGVLVHAHDVYLPYPRDMHKTIAEKISWSEQYILMAHLHNIHRYQVLFATQFLVRRYPEVLARMIDGKYHVFGSSLWYKVR